MRLRKISDRSVVEGVTNNPTPASLLAAQAEGVRQNRTTELRGGLR